MENDFNDTEEDRSEEFIRNLLNFGLSEEEAKVYFSLLKRGKRGEIVGRIKDELEIGRTTIYAVMERLNQKKWVYSEEISDSPKRIKYIANPPMEMLGNIIKEREDNLRNSKDISLKIRDKLDLKYQGAKKLTINTIHVGGYKYLKPLVEKGWKIKSEVVEHIESLEYLVLDYELKGSKGIPKDSGLIIFFYNKNIEDDTKIVQEAVEMFKTKTEYEIRRDKIPGFQDVKLDDTKFGEYPGAEVYIKLKFKKSWWNVGHQAVIPLKNKIFLIFGAHENFQILMDTILNAEKFHHLME